MKRNRVPRGMWVSYLAEFGDKAAGRMSRTPGSAHKPERSRKRKAGESTPVQAHGDVCSVVIYLQISVNSEHVPGATKAEVIKKQKKISCQS